MRERKDGSGRNQAIFVYIQSENSKKCAMVVMMVGGRAHIQKRFVIGQLLMCEWLRFSKLTALLKSMGRVIKYCFFANTFAIAGVRGIIGVLAMMLMMIPVP